VGEQFSGIQWIMGGVRALQSGLMGWHALIPPYTPVLGLPNSVEEMCPDIPVLERLMADIGGLAESGARYTEMPHVIEITLPMLCSYLPRWWERGPEAPPPALPAGAPPPCTAVTSDHLNSLLGNILRIIVNNLGIDEATWMKRLAGGSGGSVCGVPGPDDLRGDPGAPESSWELGGIRI
jgi:hypothetical protein